MSRPRRDKLHLEVDEWGEWGFEKEFSELVPAQAYGREFFPQNGWRIINARTKAVVFVYDPLEAMASTAATEIQRFASRDRWMDQFLRDRQARTARLQRRQMSAEEEEVAFGPGSRGMNQPWFNANGPHRGNVPDITDVFGRPISRQPTPHPARRLIEIFADDADDVYCRPKREKYNWQEEGF